MAAASAKSDIEAIDLEMERGLRRLRFSRPLELAFDEDERLNRTRYLVVSGAIGWVLYLGFLVFDWAMIPDVFVEACVVRLGVFAPLMGGVLAILLHATTTALREGTRAAMCVIATALIMYLLARSHSPYRMAYAAGTVLVMVFVIIQRLRFRYAVAAMAGMLAVHFSVIALSDGFDTRLRVANIVFFFAATVFLLTSAYGLEREARRSFLLTSKARLLNVELERASTTDPLTGLWNRRHLSAVMTSAWATCAGEALMAVVVVDIDHFKLLNDAGGHLEGDECLRRVGAALRQCLPEGGAAFRFGGEEFLILLPEMTAAQAAEVAMEASLAIAKLAILHPGRSGSLLTASFGVAADIIGATKPSDLIANADAALYAAKRAGRACVRIAGEAALVAA